MSTRDSETVDTSNVDYQLKSVTLDDLKVTTEYFHFPHPKKINLSYSVSEAEQLPAMRVTSISVQLANNEEEVVATIDCSFKVDFVIGDAEKPDDFDEQLNLVATRISYPYHRQLISDIVSRMGLRPTFLPAVPDVLWQQEEIVHNKDLEQTV
ncbi:hypothetical protein ACX80L_14095 [Arthrobacter sp. MDT1-48-3]